MADMLSGRVTGIMRLSGLFLIAIMGSTGLSGLQLQNKTLRLAMSQLSKSSPIFFIIFLSFFYYTCTGLQMAKYLRQKVK